jgi:hypothetical protein
MLTTPDHADAVTSPPAAAPVGPNPHGFYQDCDPATGRAGTIYRAEDFNELIQNLRALLTAAGVTAIKGDATTLRTTLYRLLGGNHGTITASRTLTPNDAGLLTVDATSANITLTLPPAAATPGGAVTYQVVRLDAVLGNDVQIVAAAGESIRNGAIHVDAGERVILRADGVNQWHVLGPRPMIRQNRTLNVAPTGTATPINPWAGDAFNTLAGALAFLQQYRIDSTTATVIITVAAGTYANQPTVSVRHPNALGIAIRGAGRTTTIFQFQGVAGLTIERGCVLQELSGLTLQYQGVTTSNQAGLVVGGNGALMLLDQVTVDSFPGYGLFLARGSRIEAIGAAWVQNCAQTGLAGYYAVYVGATASLIGTTLNVLNCTVPTYAVDVESGYVSLDTLVITTATRALRAAGPGTDINIRVITATLLSQGSTTVYIQSGAVLSEPDLLTANLWNFTDGVGASAQIYAAGYAYVLANKALTAGCKAVTSPAINTLGNVQAYILTS